MTDLHEAFRSLADDEPGESRIDPDGAVRASRARSRTRRHRWLAAGVAGALVLGVGAAVVTPRLMPGSAPAIGSAATDTVVRDSGDAERLKLLDRVVAWLQADTTLGKTGFSTGRRVVADDSQSYSFAVGDPAVPSGAAGDARIPMRVEVTVYPERPRRSAFPVPKSVCDSCTVQQTFADGPDGYEQQVLVDRVTERLAVDGWMENRRVLQRDYGTGGSVVIVAATQVPPTMDCECTPPLDLDAITQLADVIGNPAALFSVAPSPVATPAAFDPASIDCAWDSDWTSTVTHLPEDVGTITTAYLCEIVDRKVAGDGTWQFQVVRRISGGMADLQRALEEPDAAPTNGSCTAQFDIGRPIWVVGDRAALVRVPLDECGHAVESAKVAVEALPTKVVSETKLRQTESQVALDTECSQDWKDMLRVEAADNGPEPAIPFPPNPPALSGDRTWRVCAYAAEQPEGDVPIGTLLSGRKLTADEVEQVNAALARATYDPTCARDDHTRFVLLTDGRGEPYLVALDGCAVQQGIGWWRAPESLRTLLS